MADHIKDNITIRIGTPRDTTAIASVLEQAFHGYKAQYTAAAYAATISSPEGIARRMEEGPVLVAIDGDSVVGTASIVIREKEIYIRGMAVSPGYKGHQIGLRLLEEVEQIARNGMAIRLVLSTTPFLDRAIHRYTGFSFVQSDEGPTDLHGTPLFTMIKALDGA
jgi:GNAT superfamily N-acetyltransferase